MDDMTSHMSNEEFVYWSVYYGRLAQRNELAMKRVKE